MWGDGMNGVEGLENKTGAWGVSAQDCDDITAVLALGVKEITQNP